MSVPATVIEAALHRCLRGPYLRQDATRRSSANDEIAAARAFYAQAQQSFEAQDEATGLKQVWSALFRAARALVFQAGYDVEGVRCLEVVLEAHYLGQGLTVEELETVRQAQALAGPPQAALARAATFLEKAAHLVASGRG